MLKGKIQPTVFRNWSLKLKKKAFCLGLLVENMKEDDTEYFYVSNGSYIYNLSIPEKLIFQKREKVLSFVPGKLTDIEIKIVIIPLMFLVV